MLYPYLDSIILKWRSISVIIICSTLFFMLSGLYFTFTIGPHSGDEGHYLTMSESLYYDHDLDIHNNLGYPDNTPEIRHHNHVSAKSRNGHWYSWHPFGLSLILALFVPGGTILRHLILGLFGGLGCGGIIILCKSFKVSTTGTILTTGLFSLSTLWTVYASRCLPEIFGACLIIWLFIAILNYRYFPWLSVIIALISCSYLPWVHTRYVPLSVLGGVLFCSSILITSGKWKQKSIHLSIYCILCALSGIVFIKIHSYLFASATTYPIDKLLFSFPPGIWYSLATNKSSVAVIPMFAWMITATVWCIGKDPVYRKNAAFALLFFLAVLLTTSATIFWRGAASVPNRFHVVIAALLIPPAARAYDRAGPVNKWWLIFLGLLSFTQLFWFLFFLKEIRIAFCNLADILGWIHPLFSGLATPFLFYHKSLLHSFAILFFSGTLLMHFTNQSKKIFHIFLITIIFFAGIYSASINKSRKYPDTDPVTISKRLENANLDNAFLQSNCKINAKPITSFSNKFHSSKIASVTTEKLDSVVKDTLVSQPLIEVNDWADRPYKWTTLVKPFYGGKGLRLFCLRGLLEGESQAVLCIREGSHVRYEKPLETTNGKVNTCLSVSCTGNGHIYLLIRLKNEPGTFIGKSIVWTPYNNKLLEKANFTTPDCLINTDQQPRQ
ncbi:MAG: hypothetical protein P9M03_06440 [Candidatus Theseobacter exili]|nr:hypothetical protein [Candidatus Theseobacter exili]